MGLDAPLIMPESKPQATFTGREVRLAKRERNPPDFGPGSDQLDAPIDLKT